jgi:C_GCAxxG_C_C family probable redox protein
MTTSEKAVQYFRSGFNCAQAVLTPFREQYKISEEHCLKIACAFGGGMGRQQLTCGALTGAMMVLGLQFGKSMGDDDVKKKETYAKTLALFKAFIVKHGAVNCRELMDGLNMSDPEDMKKIEDLQLHRTKCDRYVMDAVEITESLIKG